MKSEKSYIFAILAALLLLGSFGAAIIERFLFPYLDFLPRSPDVITRREEVRIDEGVNYSEIARRAKNSLVSIYIHEKEFGHAQFRLADTITGTIVASDGLVAAPLPVLKAGQKVSVFVGSDVLMGSVLVRDELTGLSLVKVEAIDLPVMRQGFAREIDLGDRLVAIGNEFLPDQNSIKSLLVSEEPYLRVSLNSIYEFGRLNDPLLLGSQIEEKYLGAAVVNKDAALVGIVSSDGLNTRIVKSEDLKLLLDNFLDDQKINWPKLGFTYSFLGAGLVRALGLPQKYGILIHQAAPPLRVKDFVYKIDGKELGLENHFERWILGKQSGEKVKFELIRDGKVTEIELILQ